MKIEPQDPLSIVLGKIVKRTIGRQDEHEKRPWWVQFSKGNYGYPDTAICEMQGSPVRAVVLFRLYTRELLVLDQQWQSKRTTTDQKLIEQLRQELRKINPRPDHWGK